MEGDQRVQVRDVMVHSSRDGRYPGQWCTYTPTHAPLCTRSMHRRARPCTRVCAPTARAGTSRCESVYPFVCSRVDVQLCSRVSTYPCDRVSREMHTWTRMHVYSRTRAHGCSVWFARSLPRPVGPWLRGSFGLRSVDSGHRSNRCRYRIFLRGRSTASLSG